MLEARSSESNLDEAYNRLTQYAVCIANDLRQNGKGSNYQIDLISDFFPFFDIDERHGVKDKCCAIGERDGLSATKTVEEIMVKFNYVREVVIKIIAVKEKPENFPPEEIAIIEKFEKEASANVAIQ